MTKPREVANTANPSSIPGSRLVPNSVPGSVLELGAVSNAQISPLAGIGSEKLNYESQLSSLTRSVEDKFADTTSVLDFIPESEHAAIRAGTSTFDCSSGIQAAVDSGARAIYFPAGTYAVYAQINIPDNSAVKRLYGAGQQQTVISGRSGTFNAIFNLGSQTTSLVRGSFSDMLISANSAASGIVNYGIYGSRVEHWSFVRLMLSGFQTAAISTGYGWCNNFIDCECSNNVGDGIRLNADFPGGGGNNNAIGIYGCRIFLNKGVGIKVLGGYYVSIEACTIESNDKAGIILSSVSGCRISSYFEANSSVGWQFSVPSKLVKADIILASGLQSMTAAFPSKGIVIEGCYSSMTTEEAFVYNAGVNDLQVLSCTTPGTSKPLVLEQYRDEYKGQGIIISGCDSFSSKYEIEGFINGSGRPSNFSGSVNVLSPLSANPWNYAIQDLSQWSFLAGNVANGTYQRSENTATREFRGIPAWEINTTSGGTSDIYGFSLQADSYPELIGKLVYFGIATWDESSSCFAVPWTNQIAFNANPGGKWGVRSVPFIWPASGTVRCGFYKTGPSAGSVYAAGAVLALCGNPIFSMYSLIPARQTQWKLSSQPTNGLWDTGDIVFNNYQTNFSTSGWVCVSGGIPGTWKAMAPLVP